MHDKKIEELRAIAKEKGVDIHGLRKKTDIIERINSHIKEQLKATTETPKVETPVESPAIITDIAEVEEAVKSFGINKVAIEAQGIVSEIQEMFAGTAKVEYHGESNTILFTSSTGAQECVTVNQPKAAILTQAMNFKGKFTRRMIPQNQGIIGV
jgi:hypothetical protein